MVVWYGPQLFYFFWKFVYECNLISLVSLKYQGGSLCKTSGAPLNEIFWGGEFLFENNEKCPELYEMARNLILKI